MTLWAVFQNKKKISSSHRRIYKIPTQHQRASFFTYQSGSYTLEVAIVIPLLAAYLVTLLFFFSILELQREIDEALLFAGRKTAVESCVVESEELLFLSAEAYMMYALQDNPQIEKWIKHGVWGIQLWKSSFDEEEICLYAEYIVKLPLPFWGMDEIKLTSQNCFRKWIGDRRIETEEGYFYITKFGQVYHEDLSCRTLKRTVSSSTIDQIPFLRGKDGQKYYECGQCDWVDSKRERIYYTDYGARYHKDIACGAIKRFIQKIKPEEVGERRPCSFCCER